MSKTEKLAATLLVIGGLNWGLVGLLKLNLVSALFGGLSRPVFVLVGWAAVYTALNWKNIFRRWDA